MDGARNPMASGWGSSSRSKSPKPTEGASTSFRPRPPARHSPFCFLASCQEEKKQPKMSVLIVDDEEGLRDSLKEFLEDEGFSVSTATNGAEALALLKRDEL